MMTHEENFSRLDNARLDNALASFLVQRSRIVEEEKKKRFGALVKTLSAALASGHICIRVDAEEAAFLRSNPLVSVPTDDGMAIHTPLVMEEDRLYLHRYWSYETRLASLLKNKVAQRDTPPANLPVLLERYFPAQNGEVDWQRRAAENVVSQSFSMITGGPGTGKTYTVLMILLILQEIEQGQLNIAMAAPTGKAAMRLQESVGAGKSSLQKNHQTGQAILDSIPDTVTTIHRLLEAKVNSPYFKHHADNPLVYDLVVIDEASMVDLSLMCKLVDALKPDARLILLGDKDQLASVESGAILADLSQGLPENKTELLKTRRFNTTIKALADAINLQDQALAYRLLEQGTDGRLSLVTHDLMPQILSCYAPFFAAVASAQEPEKVFEAFEQFRILCSNRKGLLGMERLNASIERSLQYHNGINTQRAWYPGKPVMITQNDPSTRLFNGDIGICLPEQGRLLIYFKQPDNSFKKLLPVRLPAYETAYAMTIHKSQGSEFDQVLMVLPEKPNPILTKELVYTAVTRAKNRVQVAATAEIFNYALSHRVERSSGLKDKVSA